MRELLAARGMSYRVLAARNFYAKSHLHDLATGRKSPTIEAAGRIDRALDADGELIDYVRTTDVDALELARRVAASDLGRETLEQLEATADDLAVAYATTPPEQLLPQIRQHLTYVGHLVDVRKTLDQHRRLLVAGGWLALLGATVHIDLQQRAVAEVRLRTAREMADQSGHSEMAAWCLETQAWNVLTTGDYARAVALSRQAQETAPRGSSAHIQATAQEGRAWARMGAAAETRDALRRTARLVSPLAAPDRPETSLPVRPRQSCRIHSYDPGMGGRPGCRGVRTRCGAPVGGWRWDGSSTAHGVSETRPRPSAAGRPKAR